MFLIVSKFLIPKGFSGITVFPFIVFRTRFYRDNMVTVNHEKIHIRQQLELLILPFYVLYFIDFIVKYVKFRDKHLAYKNIVFEKEAYENERNLRYLENRKWFEFRRYL